jgi:hypothetical protein
VQNARPGSKVPFGNIRLLGTQTRSKLAVPVSRLTHFSPRVLPPCFQIELLFSLKITIRLISRPAQSCLSMALGKLSGCYCGWAVAMVHQDCDGDVSDGGHMPIGLKDINRHSNIALSSNKLLPLQVVNPASHNSSRPAGRLILPTLFLCLLL